MHLSKIALFIIIFVFASSLFSYDRDIISDGIDRLYHLDYEGAFRKFKLLKNRGIGYFYIAMIYWMKLVCYEDINKSKKMLDKYLDIAMNRLKPQLDDKNSNKRSIANFYYGACFGFKGLVRVYDEDYIGAYGYAIKGLKHIKIALAINNNLYDAYYGIGLYNYYVGRLPKGLKRIIGFFNIKGNKELGLKQLALAAKKANYAKIESKIILAYLYVYIEKRWDRALPFLKDLIKTYPENSRILIMYVDTLYLRRSYNDMMRVLQSFIKSIESGKRGFSSNWYFRVYYSMGKALFGLKRFDEAKRYFKLALKQKYKYPKTFVAWALLRLGRIYDIEKKRKSAIRLYKLVMKILPYGNVYRLARLHLKFPYKIH